MDLTNLISRLEVATAIGVRPQTIAKWERLGLFPEPKECLSDRLILYDREEVKRAMVERSTARRLRLQRARHGR